MLVSSRRREPSTVSFAQSSSGTLRAGEVPVVLGEGRGEDVVARDEGSIEVWSVRRIASSSRAGCACVVLDDEVSRCE